MIEKLWLHRLDVGQRLHFRRDAVAAGVDGDDGRRFGGEGGELRGDGGGELLFDGALERAGAQLGMVAALDDSAHGGRVDVENAAAMDQALAAEKLGDESVGD